MCFLEGLSAEEKEHKEAQSWLKFLMGICFPGGEDDEDTIERKRKYSLPHWLAYVAYVLCFILTIVSILFIMLYGFQFGKLQSESWVLAMLVSLALSIFVIQPLKVRYTFGIPPLSG